MGQSERKNITRFGETPETMPRPMGNWAPRRA